MDRTFHFFHYQTATLHYSNYGKGSKALFCFHGFGLTGALFYPLEELFSTEYTIYNFDLFFHGKSKWAAGETPIEEKFWTQLIKEFCKENNISIFALLGYSIGARPMWSIAQSIPEKVTAIIAIAPDGITNSLWFDLATNTVFTRTLFKLLLSNKFYINTFLSIGSLFKIIPAVTVRFARSQLRTQAQRDRVYFTWVVYRKLKSHNSILSENLNKHAIPLTIYLGEFDKIIRYKMIKPLVEKVKMNTTCTLAAGHLNLIRKVEEYIQFRK